VLTGGAGGAGSVADPTPGRLGLGCPAMRTTPHRHRPMVAAKRALVDSAPYWTTESETESVVLPKAVVVT
jgi:hypothetical protein